MWEILNRNLLESALRLLLRKTNDYCLIMDMSNSKSASAVHEAFS
jgi:hypothetical protein